MRLKDKKEVKKSGILLPLFSLPSRDGIGTLGREAYRFIDFLASVNQSYWQLLPLCPIGKGDSPYFSPSSFAGEILFIDLELLFENGLLEAAELKDIDFGDKIDYTNLRKHKIPLLKKAAQRFNQTDKNFKKFKEQNRFWLHDYALFMAIGDATLTKDYVNWEEPLKYRLPEALDNFQLTHKSDILFYEITQFFFYSQFFTLKAYAKQMGVKFIGDIPFYVAPNSADVWTNPDNFCLNKDMTPTLVAGVPPDIFSKSGQLWGNPIYDWDYMRKTGFSWWKERMLHTAKLYDVIRIDHFRAFADYYAIPTTEKTAISGSWKTGVGEEFFKEIMPFLRDAEIIAEDLGGEDEPRVKELLKSTGFPNMKLLQFAFDSDLSDPFLPQNFGSNCVCYTGTHDNDTTLGWYEKINFKERLLFSRLVCGEQSLSPVDALISFGMQSNANTVIIPMQDYLNLNSNSRTNTPGTSKGNWQWRLTKDYANQELIEKIKKLSLGRN